MFCLLVGIGSWLSGTAAPAWWPYSVTGWLGANIGCGIALIPLWHRLGFGDEHRAAAG